MKNNKRISVMAPIDQYPAQGILTGAGLGLLLIVVSASAWATKPVPSDPPTNAEAAAVAAQAQGQGQLQGQLQGQEQVATGGHASAGSSANGTGYGGSATGSVSADTGGNALSTSYDSTTRALALSLPGVPGAPAVGGHRCLEHNAVTTILGSGKGGKTELNVECLSFEQCKELGYAFLAAGQALLAVEQWKSCQGASDALDAVPYAEPTRGEYVTREEAERMFSVAQGK